MTKKFLVIPFILLVGLSGCGGWSKKANRTQSRRRTATKVVKPQQDDEMKLGFFDENIEDMESFVLDQESGTKDMALAHNELSEVNFSLDEPKQEPGLETQVVYFDFDSTDMRNDQKNSVNNVISKIKQWEKQGYKVVCKGHSCKWHGTRAYNLALSQQRAQCMADLCKISKNAMKVFGVGNEEPVSFENTMQGQAPNRRVEIYPISA